LKSALVRNQASQPRASLIVRRKGKAERAVQVERAGTQLAASGDFRRREGMVVLESELK
jgi:hypothetical protein